jgi:hypothetical protein
MMRPARPEQAVAILASYVKVGVQGLTFNNPNLNNPNLSTPELIEAAGQVKKMLG